MFTTALGRPSALVTCCSPTFTPLGGGICFPESDSVPGQIVIDPVLHEYYAVLPERMHPFR